MLLEPVAKPFSALLAASKIETFVPLTQLTDTILSTLIFVAIGLLFFGIAFVIIIKASPFSVRKEIEEDQNTALAILIGSVIIGIALIVSAAIHG
jgi:putative membrane protein